MIVNRRGFSLMELIVAMGIFAILAGLTETESVVTGGSFTMKTEFLKSRLGAGCVDD